MCCYVVLGNHVIFNCGFIFTANSTVVSSCYLLRYISVQYCLMFNAVHIIYTNFWISTCFITYSLHNTYKNEYTNHSFPHNTEYFTVNIYYMHTSCCSDSFPWQLNGSVLTVITSNINYDAIRTTPLCLEYLNTMPNRVLRFPRGLTY